VLLGLGALALAFWQVRPDLEPGTREQADAAGALTIWHATPASMEENQRYTTLANPAWFSWGNDLTTVGRHFETPLTAIAALEAWERAAVADGWELVGRTCASSPGAQVNLVRRVERWPAILTITWNRVTSGVGVSVRLPTRPGEQSSDGETLVVGSPVESFAECPWLQSRE
jgi:hypothetical protein